MDNSKLPSQNFYYMYTGRASLFTFRKAAITVEAALAVPVFLLALVSLLYLMEIMAVHTAVRSGMQYAGRALAEKAGTTPMLTPSGLERDIVTAIGAERLNRSVIVGGSGGIHCQESQMSANTGVCDFITKYEIRLPIPLFRTGPVTYRQRMRIKGWTGYVRTGFGDGKEETVYVTETGLVYHRDYHCTHLELSIRPVTEETVLDLRNEDGGRYHPCERCAHQPMSTLYITQTGDRYHSSLSCSGLKRTIYAVPVSEAVGKGECSRCGK